MTDLNKIDTIIIVMMENRSFDHMLGYLSLPDYGRTDVEGLRYKANVDPPVWDFEYVLPGGYTPFRMPDTTTPLPNNMDPPHERPNIEKQIGDPDADGVHPMKGFVDSFDGKINVDGKDQPIVMGYYTGADLPTTHFFAENFLICDHWFSAIPAGTQPNRLMAMSGKTRIDINVPKPPLPHQELAYKWLSVHDVPWRIYAESLPFYVLMPDEFPRITAHLRPFSSLAHDIVNESNNADFPKVIFVEPRYTNAPHIEPPHDDHAPTAVDGGQRFLMEVYAALTANDEVWKRSVMIVTYDENGGFFDHMSPPRVPTPAPDGNYPTFESLGVRVPAYVISPFVEPRTAYHETMDHTSILKFLGEKFNGGSYSAEVDARVDLALWSVSATLTLDDARVDPPAPPATTEGFTTEGVPFDAMSQAFAGALAQLKANHPEDIARLFPKLFAHF